MPLGSHLWSVCFPAHLLPSWKRANSRAARSNTVSDVTVTGPLALLGNMPCTRTSCQSEWSLQISTESKYLRGSWAQPWWGPLRVHLSAPGVPPVCPMHTAHPLHMSTSPMSCFLSPAPQPLPLLGTTVLDEIAVLHPEDTLAAAVGHQVVTQGSRPVWPLI